MSETAATEHDDLKKPQRPEQQSSEMAEALDGTGASGPGIVFDPGVAHSLLGDPRLSSRGNSPVRVAAALQMQRTHGNRYTRSTIQRTAHPHTSGEGKTGEVAMPGAPQAEVFESGPVGVRSDEEAGSVHIQRRRSFAPAPPMHIQRVTQAQGSLLPVQRDDPPGGGTQAPAQPGVGTKNTFTISDKIPLNKEFGPLMVKQANYKADITYMELYGQGSAGGAQGDKKSPTQGRVGTVGGVDTEKKGEFGVQEEIKHKFKEQEDGMFKGCAWNLKETGKVTTKGGELSLEAGFGGKKVSFAVKFNILKGDWGKPGEGTSPDKAGSLEILSITPSGQLEAPEIPEIDLGGGGKFKVSVKQTLSLDIIPNYKEVGKWIVEKFMQVAGSEVAIGLGMVAGGIATIWVNFYVASVGGEIAQRVSTAMDAINNYCLAYQATMTGREVSNAGGKGWAEGAQLAEQRLKAGEENVPREAIMDAARKRNLYREAFDAGLPAAREAAKKEFLKEHYIENFVYGENGPLLKDFLRVFDAAAAAPGRAG